MPMTHPPPNCQKKQKQDKLNNNPKISETMARQKQTARKAAGKTPRAPKAASAQTPNKGLKTKIAKKTVPPPPLRRRRVRPGQKALRDIRRYQRSTNPLVPLAPMVRIVKEIIQGMGKEVCRITASAVMALREAMEAYAVHLFEDAQLCALHARRITIKPSDLALARRIRGETQDCSTQVARRAREEQAQHK